MKQLPRFPLLSAVALAVAMMGTASTVHAQYRLNDDGHLNDASNRIGSGGYNGDRTTFPNGYGTASNIINNSAANNAIISGNVTGLGYFHGPAPTDPNVLPLNTQSIQTDRFLAISGPVDITQRTTGAPRVTPFYTTNMLSTQLPANSMANSTGAVLPSPPVNTTTTNTYDTRLGMINNASINYIPLPAPGELDLPGPVDPSGNPSSLIASPLYGMREWNQTDASDAYFLSRYTNVQLNSPMQQVATNAQIQQMRSELNSTIVDNSSQNQSNSQNAANTLGTTNGLAANNSVGSNSGAPIAPANANLNQSLQMNSSSNGALASSAISNPPLNSNISNQQLGSNSNYTPGTRQQLVGLVPPDQQSAQLKDLEQRLASNRQNMTPEQAAQAFNREQQYNTESKNDELTKSATPGVPNSPTAGQAPDMSAPGMIGTTPSGLKPTDVTPPPMNPLLSTPLPPSSDKPYIITSLASGIKAKGLSTLLSTAEDQMRQGKFSSALDTYDEARQVAPNNPFAILGRAFAELGAASYGRSEQDLRQAFSMESGAVLLGQYDLRGFLGVDRLKFVVKDLKQINAKEKNERSAFLLAYIAHNVGDDENAAKFLNDAEERIGGADPIIALMRDSWMLKK
jgi:hypothetical protein